MPRWPLKQRMAIMVDEALGAMNMPTRSELRTLQDRLQETRRENKPCATRSRPCSSRSRRLAGGATPPRSRPAALVGTRAAPTPAPAPKKAPAARKTAPKPRHHQVADSPSRPDGATRTTNSEERTRVPIDIRPDKLTEEMLDYTRKLGQGMENLLNAGQDRHRRQPQASRSTARTSWSCTATTPPRASPPSRSRC